MTKSFRLTAEEIEKLAFSKAAEEELTARMMDIEIESIRSEILKEFGAVDGTLSGSLTTAYVSSIIDWIKKIVTIIISDPTLREKLRDACKSGGDAVCALICPIVCAKVPSFLRAFCRRTCPIICKKMFHWICDQIPKE